MKSGRFFPLSRAFLVKVRARGRDAEAILGRIRLGCGILPLQGRGEGSRRVE